MSDHLLPAASTPLEQALSILDGERLGITHPAVLASLFNPQTAPAAFLPALAAELSVEEEWDLAVTEQQQRDLLANAYALNARKGTPFAIKRGLAVIGFPGATLVEGFAPLRYDGTFRHTGRERYNSRGRWALFDVLIPRGDDEPFGPAERARALRGIEIWQRAACYLRALRPAISPVIVREPAPTATTVWRPGIVLKAKRQGDYDGRFTYGALNRYRYDGRFRHDGTVPYDGRRVPGTQLRHKPEPTRAVMQPRMHLTARRGTTLRYDGGAYYDGTLRHGYDGALVHGTPLSDFSPAFSADFV
ncbi:phage tail protein I [Methylobacterium hispanicum]|uniref:phage tail protein I n=1 Tax=Methylobacterium hispanicum TaxID=270350 RepID=UPI002F2BE0D4